MADFPYQRDVDHAAEADHRARTEATRPLKRRFSLAGAEALAEKIAAELHPACERVEIAGSIRRRRPKVKDVELLVAPKLDRDLLGNVDEDSPTELDRVLARLIDSGRLELRDSGAGIKNGPRYKSLRAVKTGIPVDLFIVRPPASFAVQFAIRTGPRDFSRDLVVSLRRRGMRCVDGRVRDRDGLGETVPTPTERDFLRLCGAPWVEPEDRR